MDKGLLHTPEGVRDIYNGECLRKLSLEERIWDTFLHYGYHPIQTPTFEFFDIFNKERGSVASKNMYKFFDREGHTLVLRPDMTPAIARSAAKYYMDETLPIRLCYKGNTFKNNSEHQGKLKESTQMGCEFIGDDTADADAELLAMAIEALLAAGLKEFQIDMGQVDFFRGLLEEAGIQEETEEELRHLIEEKNYFGVEQLLEPLHLPVSLKETLLKLPELFGSVEILETAKALTTNKRALQAIARLEEVYQILAEYGLEQYVSVDLGMLSNYNYYTGIIFKGFTYGTGAAIVGGGRYDHLLQQFGKQAPAVGIGIQIDRLMIALAAQKIEIPDKNTRMLLLYTKPQRKQALEIAKKERAGNCCVELLLKKDNVTLEEYIAYGQQNGAAILYDLESVRKVSL